jgi:tetratricopeptide (TPR) repeat protein
MHRLWRVRIMSRNRFRVLVVCLVAGFIAGAPLASPAASQADAAKASIQERLNRIREGLFSGTGRVDEAIRDLKGILALDPGSAEGHLLLGIAYRTQGSPELVGEAVAELRQALALNSSFVPARFYLAHIYLDLGRAERAREELETARAQAPANPQFLALLGEAERQLKNPRRSLELNRQALQIDESFAEARYYLGLALYDLGQRDEAINELERVVQSGPKVVDAYLSLGTVYLEAGGFDKALGVLLQGTKIDPARSDIRIQMARAYRSKGLLVKAEEQLKLATPKGASGLPSSFSQHQQVEFDFYLEQGLVKLQRRQLEAAAAAFRKVLDIDPHHGPTNRHLAEVYLLQGLYARASEHAARAEKLGFPLSEDKRKLLQERLHKKETGGRE